MKTHLICLTLALWIFAPAMAKADADGPDYFRVIGVASNDVLQIRSQPTAQSSKIGTIPPDGDGIQNLGCQGGLTFAQWQNASTAERDAARLRIWCRIDYRGVNGWVAGRFVVEGSAP